MADAAQLEITGCGETVIDSVSYRGLPSTGSLSFDGNQTPNASTNDNADPDDIASSWCNDAATDGGLPGEVGTPGTPRSANRPCSQ